LKKLLWTLLGVASAGVLCTSGVWAQEMTNAEIAQKLTEHKVLLDTLWVMVAAFLVFWMQAGFAYVEGGLTRAKNTNNIMMKNLMDFSLGSLAYWAVGFAIMFGAGNAFMGTSGWFLSGPDNSPATGDAYQGVFGALNWTGVPLFAKFMFQLVFAATAATIVSGAMAERTKFKSYLVYSVVITAFIYPVSATGSGAAAGCRPGACGTSPARRWCTASAAGSRSPARSWSVRGWANTGAMAGPTRSPAIRCRWRRWACSSCGWGGSASTPARPWRRRKTSRTSP
jgi:hypothetical protein